MSTLDGSKSFPNRIVSPCVAPHHLWLMLPLTHDQHVLVTYLPLGLLAVNKGLQDVDHLLQRLQVFDHLLMECVACLTLRDVGVEVLAVRASAHGGAEDGLNDKRVVGLEGGAVGAAEGVSKLLLVVLDVGVESKGDELEATAAKRVLESKIRQHGEGGGGAWELHTGSTTGDPRWPCASWSSARL